MPLYTLLTFSLSLQETLRYEITRLGPTLLWLWCYLFTVHLRQGLCSYLSFQITKLRLELATWCGGCHNHVFIAIPTIAWSL